MSAALAFAPIVDDLVDADQRPVLEARDLARRFRTNTDWIYRHIDKMIAEEKFPPPLSKIGRKRWDASSVDAWFTRYHPDRLSAAAAQAEEAEDWQGKLHKAYGGGR